VKQVIDKTRKPVGKKYLTHSGSGAEAELFKGMKKRPVKHTLTSPAYFLENKIGNKAKTDSRLSRRNGIPDRRQGDKPYAHVEYSKDFFKQRGLVPQIEFSKTLLKGKLSEGKGGFPRRYKKKPMKSYKQVISEQRHRGECADVAALPTIPCDGVDDSD